MYATTVRCFENICVSLGKRITELVLLLECVAYAHIYMEEIFKLSLRIVKRSIFFFLSKFKDLLNSSLQRVQFSRLKTNKKPHLF